ncbi:UNVERIFIED_CONTAM: hypothetical protein Slati_3978400 [Sesamum latifolium]|uniref:Uncharacterized protein n=1 Tax=Sesamum latifolium TaxID=2727402 RepID=A0AAW2TNY0_9LAMI
MVRPIKTRFATTFLTLKRFHTKKANLKETFTFQKWTKGKYAKETQEKLVTSTILKTSFWNNVLYILKVVGPLVKVLRLVDGEKRLLIGYIYEAMDRAKEETATSFSNVEEKYRNSFDVIDGRWDIQFYRPLHTAGYYLNLEFYYSNPSVEKDKEVMDGLFKCIERALRRRYDARDTIDQIALRRLNLSDEDDDKENAPFERIKKYYVKGLFIKATKRASTFSKPTTKRLHLIDEDEEEKVNFNDTDEKDLDCYKSNSDQENKTNNEDEEEEEIGEDLDFD